MAFAFKTKGFKADFFQTPENKDFLKEVELKPAF